MRQQNDENYDHILKYTGIFGGIQGLNILVSLVRNKLVALLLGPEGMGLSSLFTTTSNMISQATNMGISISSVRQLSEWYDRGDRARLLHFVGVVRAWSLLTGLVGLLLAMLLGPLLSRFTFTWGDHSLHFMLLGVLVLTTALTGGETAILKGTRQLKSLAVIQIVVIVLSLFIAVPVYWLFGQSGIVPVMILSGIAVLLVTAWRSCRLYPPALSLQFSMLGDGLAMVRLGIAFTLAGIAGSGADFLIRSYLNNVADLEVVGLYNVGYLLTMTYAGMVFSALETDYFPRLSAVQHDVMATNQTVNRQMEVSLLLLSPMLAALIVALPVLIPLLFSSRFLPVVAMTQVAALAMYLKVLTLPVAYITLARGRSVAFLMLEVSYYVVLVALVVVCFERWGLLGAGVALLLAHLFDYVIINGFAYKKYGYRCSVTVFRYAFVQLSLGVFAYVLTLVASGTVYWLLGAVVTSLSAVFSLQALRSKAHLWETLTRRFQRQNRKSSSTSTRL